MTQKKHEVSALDIKLLELQIIVYGWEVARTSVQVLSARYPNSTSDASKTTGVSRPFQIQPIRTCRSGSVIHLIGRDSGATPGKLCINAIAVYGN